MNDETMRCLASFISWAEDRGWNTDHEVCPSGFIDFEDNRTELIWIGWRSVTEEVNGIPVPVTIDRTHANRAYVTLGFADSSFCTDFIKAAERGFRPRENTRAQSSTSGGDAVACDHNRAISSMSGLYYCMKCFVGMGSPTDYPECSGNPADCPENEGYGCCKRGNEISIGNPVAWRVIDAKGNAFTIYNPQLAEAIKSTAQEFGSTLKVTALCEMAPSGWLCTRSPGHDGPCAAHENYTRSNAKAGEVDDAMVERAAEAWDAYIETNHWATVEGMRKALEAALSTQRGDASEMGGEA